jgi:hypothetical protein
MSLARPVDPELLADLKMFKDVPLPDLPNDGNKD